jgi:endoglucanase
MKNRRFLFFAVAITLFSTLHSIAQPVKTNGQLAVKGTALTNMHGNTVMLRGMSFGWHNWWPRFYNAKTVNWLYSDWGCNVVRAAMGVEPNGAFIDNPKLAEEKVTAVVEGAIAAGIYVIIDWHSHHVRLPEAKAFFTKMATKYGKYPNVIYEIYNEPEKDDWPTVKAYSEEMIKTIRAIDAHNIILVGTPHWDQDIHLAAADPIVGATNIMYTMHFYAATHKQWLRDRCDEALKKGIPIFVSESAGMEATGDGPLNLAEWQNWIDWMESRKISWITWSVSDKDETCSVLQKTASSEGGWKMNDLKESGQKSREFIRKLNGKK